MSFKISTAAVDQADLLIRQCEFPAMIDNPLRKIMFPRCCQATEGEVEQEILWTVQSLQQNLESGILEIRTVCLETGLPVGFAIWSLDQASQKQEHKDKADNSSKRCIRELPTTLDIQSWSQVSKLLRAERTRILRDLHNIWRLQAISVNPTYQRQGAASLLLDWGCRRADEHGYVSFVMASPAAVHLYAKFGYTAVGAVRTAQGTFTSMLRAAKSK
ncbi:hypothetical protein EV356DRAFT_277183 [Viridothelium virens]|uniref:N-acetyltransferase domain-containing protein n=1 Tax=Viridothelium virens TaxID=1048519 RepID=A0A6A6H305_VIRVR|nr:hypothetical protein EV356DRAFT_277183 [Viridothelium virens]